MFGENAWAEKASAYRLKHPRAPVCAVERYEPPIEGGATYNNQKEKKSWDEEEEKNEEGVDKNHQTVDEEKTA